MRIKQSPTVKGRMWGACLFLIWLPLTLWQFDMAPGTDKTLMLSTSVFLACLCLLGIGGDIINNSRSIDIDLNVLQVSIHTKNLLLVTKTSRYQLDRFVGVVSYLNSEQGYANCVALVTRKDNKYLPIVNFPSCRARDSKWWSSKREESPSAQSLRSQLSEGLNITNRGFIGYGDFDTQVRPDALH